MTKKTKPQTLDPNNIDESALEIRKLMLDPVWKAKNLFGFHPWSKQAEILHAVRKHKRVAVRSSHGIGKTAIAACVVLDFMTEGPCRVITTAPTWSQVEQLLWREIAQRHAQIEGGFGTIYKTMLEVDKNWVAMGLSTDTPERFQGHHHERLLLVVDEASGVDELIYEASMGYLTAGGARMLLIGNPTKTSGTFYRAFKPESGWHRIHVSAFDTPAFTGEQVPANVTRALVTKEWVADAKIQWGEDSSAYKIRVLGDFAETTGRQYFNFLDRFETTEPTYRGRLVGAPYQGGQLTLEQDTTGALKVWKSREENHRYIVFADVAGGVRSDDYNERVARNGADSGSDYSCAMVMDAETAEIVAELHYRSDLDQYADDLARLGYWYNRAVVAIERNGPGQAVIIHLAKSINYPNLYRPRRIDSTRPDLDTTYGWLTTGPSRVRMLTALQEHLRDHPNLLNSETLLDEMRTFVYNKRGREQADNGCHDDRVLAAAGCVAVWTENYSRPQILAPPRRSNATNTISRRAPRPN